MLSELLVLLIVCTAALESNYCPTASITYKIEASPLELSDNATKRDQPSMVTPYLPPGWAQERLDQGSGADFFSLSEEVF